MKQVTEKYIIFSAILIHIFGHVSTENVYKQLENLNPQQERALDELKRSVSPILSQDWMKEDIYLVKFLEFNRFNVKKSEDHLKEMLKWRQENNVDKVLTNPPEYFEEFKKDYPVYADGYDKEGRPICEFHFGGWPIRKAALAGNIKKLSLYTIVNCNERLMMKVREQQAAGKNVTDYIVLTNMDGFNLLEQGCPACLPFSLAFASAIDRYYPTQAKGFWNLNTPDSFASIFRLLKPVLSPTTRAAAEFFTSNEAEWKPFLEKRVDFSQISDWYGGSKERKLT